MHESPHLTSVAPFASGAPNLSNARAKESGNTEGEAAKALIYVARVPDEALAEHLKSQGWTVSIARSASDAARLVKPDMPYAGILDMTRFNARDLGGLEASLRQQQIGWIALPSPERPPHPR